MTKRLVLVELNEINFEMVQGYVESGAELPGFTQLMGMHNVHTSCEERYELLVPWIQWVSVHSGQRYGEHRVFRLGDIVTYNGPQIFNEIETAGWRVGVIGAMNAKNTLSDPAYFIPDPWTQTPPDKSLWNRFISVALSQAVNDNSTAKLTIASILRLAIGLFFRIPLSRLISLALELPWAVKYPWRKALFLDRLLYEIHKKLFLSKKCDFSTVFLNAGAHVQHHYLFNSSEVDCGGLSNPDWYVPRGKDPVLEMLQVYDQIISDLLRWGDQEILVATGLSQVPFHELKFYYRLKDHAAFLTELGVSDFQVFPRMTRDFLVSLPDENKASEAAAKIASVMVDNVKPMFEEVDQRGAELFVVLTWPHEINESTTATSGDLTLPLADWVSFVAIKNGEHNGKGWAFFSGGIKDFAPQDGDHVASLYGAIAGFFEVPSSSSR